MKKGTRKDVLDFMESIETGKYSANEFLIYYVYFDQKKKGVNPIGIDLENLLLTGYGTEGILRARRYIIANYGIGKRTKADTTQEYIEEYARTNKYKICE